MTIKPGRIVTKTKIIKEVVGKDGRTEIVEDEELDEAMFGPDLANITRLSNSSSSQRQNGSVETRSVPIYQLGPPVVSSTFERGAAGRMSLSSCSGKEEKKEERREESVKGERQVEIHYDERVDTDRVEDHQDMDSEAGWDGGEKDEILARREESSSGGEGGGGLQRGIPLQNLNLIPMENGKDDEGAEEDHEVSDLIEEALSAEIDVDEEIVEAEPEKGVVVVLGAGSRVGAMAEGLEARGRSALACAVDAQGLQQYRWQPKK